MRYIMHSRNRTTLVALKYFRMVVSLGVCRLLIVVSPRPMWFSAPSKTDEAGAPCCRASCRLPGRSPRRRLFGGGQIGHGGLHAPVAVRDFGKTEAHFDARERAENRQIVGVSEVPDPENLVGKPGEAGAERHVEVLEHHLAQAVGAMPGRHEHGGQHRRIVFRILAEEIATPRAHRPPPGLCVPSLS